MPLQHDKKIAAIEDVIEGKAGEETVRVLEEWAQIEPNNPNPWRNIGEALQQRAKAARTVEEAKAYIKDAIKAVDKALSLDPKDPSALSVRAVLAYVHEEDENKAREMAKRLLEVMPDNVQAKKILEKVGSGGGCSSVLFLSLIFISLGGWLLLAG